MGPRGGAFPGLGVEGSIVGGKGRSAAGQAHLSPFYRFLVWNQWVPAPLHWSDDADSDSQVC